MILPKGGRGHKAPYQTTHARIPVDLKAQVDSMVEQYRELVFQHGSVEPEKLVVSSSSNFATLPEAIAIAKRILNKKLSPRQALEKLLTELYKEDVKL
jgi:hypothetical protein